MKKFLLLGCLSCSIMLGSETTVNNITAVSQQLIVDGAVIASQDSVAVGGGASSVQQNPLGLPNESGLVPVQTTQEFMQEQIPEHFPRYAQDVYGLWYFTFPTEVKRVHTLFSTKDNLEMIEPILKHHEYKGNILDCGSHIGTFSVPLASKISGTVFSFEMQQPISLQLSMNAFLNNLDIQVFNTALGNPQTTEEFADLPVLNYTTEGVASHLGAFSLLEDFRQRHKLLFNKEADKKFKKVKLEKIDTFNLNNLMLVKVDVEGMDLDVIKGMQETLERSNFPPILFECHDMNSEYGKNIFSHLRSIGYVHFHQSKFSLDYITQHNSREPLALPAAKKMLE